MNPDSEVGGWMRVCLGLDDELNDIERAGIHLELRKGDVETG